MIETIIALVLVLGLLILVHELGHFMTARYLGVDVEEFGMGFPPKIFGFKKGGVLYSINWIPFGGFVKIKGESGEDRDNPKSFASQAPWKKSIILSAGVIMNVILAFVLFWIGFNVGLPQALDDSVKNYKITDKNIVVAEVLPNSPAERSSWQIGDKIISVNGQTFDNMDDLQEHLQKNQEQESEWVIAKGDEQKSYKLTPEILEDQTKPMVGIVMLETGVVHYGFLGSIWQAAKVTYLMIGQMFEAFYSLIYNLISRGALDARLSGPVGVAVIASQVVSLGWIHVLQFAAVLSLNLAVINILPFPALDGGRLLFVLVETISHRRLNQKAETWIHNSGFILLIILLIFITIRDVGRFGANWFK